MSNIARCDWCNKESPYPVFNWYKVERWTYPDHTDKNAPKGPWHFCSMSCIGEYFSRVQKLDTTTVGSVEKTFVEHLPSMSPPKPTPPPLRTVKEGSVPLPSMREVKKYRWHCNHGAYENPEPCDCPPGCVCRQYQCAGKSVPARYL